MKIGSAFPGKHIKTADLNGKRVTVTIDRVVVEDVGDDTKPVVYFRGKDRGMALNVTNANSISMIVGDDETDKWPGHTITLYPSKTDYQGKRVDCIRVDPPPAGSKPTPPPTPPPDTFTASDDDVPF